ncbi:hypothetical protein ACFY74_12010 [Streptomyces massasporeus]|uniref:hypothetical protein n=1 Tax=Streptomyces massasporeus TaxID=67324 RepID=UPI0036A75611
MDLASGSRATNAAAAVAMLGGLPALLYGILHDDTARSVGGACLIMTALILTSLVAIRRWIVDTSDERRALADEQRRASEAHHRYVASQAALENEQARLTRDMAIERQRIAAQLIAEREAMRDEFDNHKATLIAETMEATFLMIKGGKFAPEETPQKGNLIRFPKDFPAQGHPASPERERSRGHEVGHP